MSGASSKSRLAPPSEGGAGERTESGPRPVRSPIEALQTRLTARTAALEDVEMPGVPTMADVTNAVGFEEKLTLARRRRAAVVELLQSDHEPSPDNAGAETTPEAVTSGTDGSRPRLPVVLPAAVAVVFLFIAGSSWWDTRPHPATQSDGQGTSTSAGASAPGRLEQNPVTSMTTRDATALGIQQVAPDKPPLAAVQRTQPTSAVYASAAAAISSRPAATSVPLHVAIPARSPASERLPREVAIAVGEANLGRQRIRPLEPVSTLDTPQPAAASKPQVASIEGRILPDIPTDSEQQREPGASFGGPAASEPPPGTLHAADKAPRANLVDVSLFVPTSVTGSAVREQQSALSETGYALSGTLRVNFAVSRTQVRYYHPEDLETSRRIANSIGADLRDFTEYQPSPPEGTIEVWLKGTPNRVARSQSGRSILERLRVGFRGLLNPTKPP